MAKIFEPFFANSHPGLGSSFGLGLVREVVRKHNGQIEADLDSQGGMRINVRVPVEEAG